MYIEPATKEHLECIEGVKKLGLEHAKRLRLKRINKEIDEKDIQRDFSTKWMNDLNRM